MEMPSSSSLPTYLELFQKSLSTKDSPDSDNCDVNVEILSSSGSRHQKRIEGGSDSGVSEDHLSLNEEPEEEPYGVATPTNVRKNLRKIVRYQKQFVMFICWLTFITCLMLYPEDEQEPMLMSVKPGKGLTLVLDKDLEGIGLVLKLRGAFNRTSFEFEAFGRSTLEKDHRPGLTFVLQEVSKEDPNGKIKNITLLNHIQVAHPQIMDETSLVNVEKLLSNINFQMNSYEYHLLFFTNLDLPFSMELILATSKVSQGPVIIWALLLLLLTCVYIMWDLVHRTFASIICCTLGIGILAALHSRPSLSEAFQFIEFDIIMSFFGLSIIMEILAETGVQDYLAALSYELANGHIWPLLNFLFLISCSLTMIYDDITLMLFLAPISLRLCEIMHLNCTPVLSCLIIAINVGSTLTPCSSVTNSQIANHHLMAKEHMGFFNFTVHMLPATLLTLAQSYIHLRLQFINSTKIGTKEPVQVERLKRLTRMWRKVSDRMGGYSLDERTAKDTVDTRIRSLRKRLKRLGKMPIPPHGFEEKVQKLRDSFPLKRIPLLVACLVALFVVLFLSLLNQFTNLVTISFGWTCILGSLLALSLCNYEDFEGVMSRIDWAAMLFLSSRFILMNVFTKLGLREAIGLFMERLIHNTVEEQRFTVAIVSILWISAGLTIVMNNAPVVNMMLNIITVLGRQEDINLPLMPMVWSLALGCCLGGNGTMTSSLVNIACAGVASKHGYTIRFLAYLKIGFFVMMGNVALATCYLLLAHVVGRWH